MSMIDSTFKLLLFIKDFTGRGADCFYWLDNDQLKETSAEDVVASPHGVVCHDFWMIRDTLFDRTGDLPATIIDLDELRITISGNPEDRLFREKLDITAELESAGLSAEYCAIYRQMFHRGVAFDLEVATQTAMALMGLYLSLCEEAKNNGEFERFFNLEVPVYRLLQKAMSAGVGIDATGLSEKRQEAEYDYFFNLKNYSAKHNMPLETPSKSAVEEKLRVTGFEFDGVSTEYVLEYVPHEDNFGIDTLALWSFDVAKQILSSVTLSSGRTRPIIDVFGSRTSRVHLRSPSLQNMPKKYRAIVAAKDGHDLSYVDFDQYEVGIMAALSRDSELASLYAAGDMYELFATKHLGLTGDRRAAKQLFLSYAYGMSRKALIDAAVSLGAERAQAKVAFNLFTRYEAWKKEVWADFQRDGHVSTILGNHYKRSKTGSITEKEKRSVVSQVVQGTASLIFKKALLEVSRLEDVTIIMPMHDALLFEHRQSETPGKVVEIFEYVMTTVLEGNVSGKASVGQFVP